MSAGLEKNGVRVIEWVEIASTFWSRMTGLMGRCQIAPGCALLIPHCSSVHTFFMRFHLDLIFLDSGGTVVKVVRDVAPYRIVTGGMRARTTVEVASGWLAATVLQSGDVLTLSGVSRPRTEASRTGSPTS